MSEWSFFYDTPLKQELFLKGYRWSDFMRDPTLIGEPPIHEQAAILAMRIDKSSDGSVVTEYRNPPPTDGY